MRKTGILLDNMDKSIFSVSPLLSADCLLRRVSTNIQFPHSSQETVSLEERGKGGGGGGWVCQYSRINGPIGVTRNKS